MKREETAERYLLTKPSNGLATALSSSVIPVETGIRIKNTAWIPAFAGMTSLGVVSSYAERGGCIGRVKSGNSGRFSVYQ